MEIFKFTKSNLTKGGELIYLRSEDGPPYWGKIHPETHLINKPIPWQTTGRQYTKSGYGSKIPTQYMVNFEGKIRRIYLCIWSNIGSLYFMYKGNPIYI